MNALTLQLLWCVAQVTVLSLMTLLAYWLLRRRSSELRAGLLQASFVLVSGLSLLALSPWPNWWPAGTENGQLTQSARQASTAPRDSGSPSPDLPLSPSWQNARQTSPADAVPATFNDEPVPSPTQAFFEGMLESLRTPPEPVAAETQAGGASWPQVINGVLIGLVGLRLLMLVWDAWQVSLLRRRSREVTEPELLELRDVLQAELGCARRIGLRVSDRIATAAATGWFRPVILLSSDWRNWSGEQLRGILAHEISHLQNHDTVGVLLSELALAFHFYHPLLHWLNRRFHLEQEFQADATAARTAGGEQRYLKILAQLALSQDARRAHPPLPAFLTSESPLLRRIEMLKKPLPASVSRTGKRLLIAGMILLAGLLAGLRSPEARQLLAEEPAPATPVIIGETPLPAAETLLARNTGAGVKAPAVSSLAWVPESLVYLIEVKLEALRKAGTFNELLAMLDEENAFRDNVGLTLAEISRVQVLLFLPDDFPGDRLPSPHEALLYHTPKPIDQEAVLKNLVPQGEPKPIKQGRQWYYQISNRSYVAFPTANLMITSSQEEALQTVLAAGEEGSTEARWVADWERVSPGELSVLGRLNMISKELDQQMNNGPEAQVLGMFTPLWRDTQTLGLCVSAGEECQLRGYATLNKPEDAKKVRRTIEAALTLAENGLGQVKQSLEQDAVPEGEREMVKSLLAVAESALAVAEVKEEGNLVTLDASLEGKSSSKLLKALLPAVVQARLAARRSQSMNHMKQIALAFHNYYDVHGRMPPAVVMGPDGKTPHSWRVELLPYLEAADVYNEYRMNEPWDSEHNKKLLARMPAVFRHPQDNPMSQNAGYFVLVGQDTMFGKKEGVRFQDVTDGTSNTLLTVSAKREIPWTKPEDIPYVASQPLPKFGGFFKEGFEAGLTDGSVRFISHSIEEKTLRLLITINDGTPIPQF